jgi:hypothetical protein
MSENMNVMPPVAPGAPQPKKTNWLLIGAIVVGVIALCGCLVCFGGPALLTLMGPQIGSQFLGIICGIQYSNLSSDQCTAWANDISTNHMAEYAECSTAARDSSGSTDTTKLFACLKDKGLAPGQ